MEKQPIKTWSYIDTDHKLAQISFDGEDLINQRYYLTTPQVCSPRKMLSLEGCLTDYKTDCAVLKYLVNSYKYDPIQFNEKDEKHWRFWRYLYLSKLPTLTLLATPKYSLHEPFLELSTEGLRGGAFKRTFGKENEVPKKVYDQNYRLDYLFFHGPKLPSLLLEDRKLLRQSILDALNPDAGFTLKDAFPLFDYSKIEYKKWEFLATNSSAGESIELSPKGYFTIARWDNPRDGGEMDYSIEEIWTKRPHFVGEYNKEANEWIGKTLENALIKEE